MPTPEPQDAAVRLLDYAASLRENRGRGPKALIRLAVAAFLETLVELVLSLRAEAAERAAAAAAPLRAVAPAPTTGPSGPPTAYIPATRVLLQYPAVPPLGHLIWQPSACPHRAPCFAAAQLGPRSDGTQARPPARRPWPPGQPPPPEKSAARPTASARPYRYGIVT